MSGRGLRGQDAREGGARGASLWPHLWEPGRVAAPSGAAAAWGWAGACAPRHPPQLCLAPPQRRRPGWGRGAVSSSDVTSREAVTIGRERLAGTRHAGGGAGLWEPALRVGGARGAGRAGRLSPQLGSCRRAPRAAGGRSLVLAPGRRQACTARVGEPGSSAPSASSPHGVPSVTPQIVRGPGRAASLRCACGDRSGTGGGI